MLESLALAVEDLDRLVIERDPARSVRLGVLHDGAACNGRDRPLDRQRAGPGVEVRPTKTAHLATPGAGRREDTKQRTELGVVFVGSVEQLARDRDARRSDLLATDLRRRGTDRWIVRNPTHFTPWPSAPRSTAWTWRTEAGDRPPSWVSVE